MTDPAEEDPSGFLDRLAAGVRRGFPGAALELEQRRSLGDRLAGRPGRTVALRFDGAAHRLTLSREAHGWRGESARVVGGIVIAREVLPLGRWLDAFAGEVAASAATAAGDAAVARRALGALGLGDAVERFSVDRDDVTGGLRALVAEAEGALPDPDAATVRRIVALLEQALPRTDGEAGALVRRTATVYLPDTLRAWAALPPGWRGTLRDGATAEQALTSQLAAIEQAAIRMRDAAVVDDADALLLNGAFLEQRFD